MKYSALIQNRKSVREFSDRYVSFEDIDKIKTYYSKSVRRLLPEVETELRMFGLDARAVLEGAAGYKQFLVGSPQYMVLLSAKAPGAGENAGYIMEDLILKLTDMGLDSCWLTFTDSEHVKTALEIDSSLDVAAIAAFGYGVKTTKRLRLNVLSMSKVDVAAQRQYFSPKKGVGDLVFLDSWGNRDGVEAFIGFYDDMLWESFYAASLSPSYLNRQPYGFVLRDGRVYLVQAPDEHTGEIDGRLGLGIVLLYFSALAEQWAGKLNWNLEAAGALSLPEGYKAIASAAL
ncbi:MAG: nitroreductase family protein [Oscillibacter sp.]|nr:nitroreductase family protein [Oscillibacter sp.]